MKFHKHTLACIEGVQQIDRNGHRQRHLLCNRDALAPRQAYRARSPKHLTLGDVVFWWLVLPPPGPL